ncbi:Sulfate permease family protein [Dirofilaria immitis]
MGIENVWANHGLNQDEYDQKYRCKPKPTIKHRLKKAARRCLLPCSSRLNLLHSLMNLIPILQWLPKYNWKADTFYDIIAGLTVGVMHIPQGPLFSPSKQRIFRGNSINFRRNNSAVTVYSFGLTITISGITVLTTASWCTSLFAYSSIGHVGFMRCELPVCQGIAYAILAGVEPVYGLYVSFFSVFFYMFFGTSKHASVGSFAITAIMAAFASGEIMQKQSEIDSIIVIDNNTVSSLTYLEITTTLAFTTGIVELAAGVLQLEFITSYFSDSLISGFITATAVHVVAAQLDDFFGFSAPKFSGIGHLFKRIYGIIMCIPQTNLYTFGMSIFGVIFLYLGKSFMTPFLNKHLPFNIIIPYELFLIIISIIISYMLNFHTDYGVPIVGEIPTALPKPRLPCFDIVLDCFPHAIGIAAVTVAIHISLAKIVAKQMKYDIDSKQELYALGFTSILSSLFPIYPISTALARTTVSVEVGTRSQFSAISTCLLLLAVILVLGPLLNALPICILSAIIMMSLRSMFQKFSELPKIWPISKIDFLIWVVAFMTTVGLDVMIGLIISVLFVLITLIFRSQFPRWERLVQLSASEPYFDNPKRYISSTNNPNIRLYRFESPLLFNNVERFKLNVYGAIKGWENKPDATNNLKNMNDLKIFNQRYLLLDCSAISYIDCMGLNMLKEVVNEVKSQKITTYFAACNTSVRDSLEVAKIFETIPKHCFFPTIDDALVVINQSRGSSGNTISVIKSNYNNIMQLRIDPDMLADSENKMF